MKSKEDSGGGVGTMIGQPQNGARMKVSKVANGSQHREQRADESHKVDYQCRTGQEMDGRTA